MGHIARFVGVLVAVLLAGSCTWSHRTPAARPAPPVEAAAPADDGAPFLTTEPDGPPGDVVGLPGEFDPVDSLLVGWHADAWSYLPVYATLVREASRRSKVLILVPEPADEELIRFHLAAAGAEMGRIELVPAPLDSVWIRDYGPLVVRTRDHRLRVIDLPYDRSNDDRVPALVAARAGWSLSRPPIQMDGGHLLSDGTGRCIATDDLVVLNGEMGIGEDQVRSSLRDYLGCRTLTLVPALDAEATGHVDLMVYVTAPGKVLVGRYRPYQDLENHRRLEAAADILEADGFEVTRIPMPDNDRRMVFRSYTNALAVNDAVFVPIYKRHRRFERAALRVFRRAFPDRTIIPVEADEVMEMGGAIHCITMTVPAP